MSATIQLTWPMAKWPNPNRDRKKHWTRERSEARAIRTTAQSLGVQALTRGTTPMRSPIAVTLAWAFPDARERDLENWSSKALLDGLVDSGLIAGDSTRHIVRTERVEDPERSPKGMLRVTVVLAEVSKAGADALAFRGDTWDNGDGPRGAVNTAEGLTRISEIAERG